MTQIDLLKKYGLAVRGRLGQHLLIDANVSRKIVQALELKASDRVLEIGPGLGSLTGEILKSGCRVLAVEKDPRFAEVLALELKPLFKDRLEIACEDFLKFDLRRLDSAAGAWKVISNLPYYVTAPILFRLFERPALFSRAVLMMQKEVARRLTAAPGTKDYGRLTLGSQYFTRSEHVMDVRPSCFTPKPQVDSSVVRLTFLSAREKERGADEERLFRLVRTAFSQRRKTLLHLLAGSPDFKKPRQELEKIFSQQGLLPGARGESLSLEQFMALSKAL